ncbi:phosphoribosyltransferase [Amycolatopsis nigrescens]|uniref:phosphoribosyltransferase n=1 Tax=Amycolatopsis nigrescens TaxID=381445 RepID=UPI000378D401|nr:phosphoribosyltransferase family protein [Amycolatopsis nigrescens]
MLRNGPTAGPTFADRAEAGRRLSGALSRHEWHQPVVLGLARGGVPVAEPVAAGLGAPLDVAVVRKIGAPGHPEFGVGAVTPTGPPWYDRRNLAVLGLTPDELAETCRQEWEEARRRVRLYRDGVEPPALEDRDVLVVDDGLATGVTATAAVRSIREARPRRVVFAAPVCAPDAAEALRGEADEVVCVSKPDRFTAVGQWYRDFRQTTDKEVVRLLATARRRC